MVRQSELESRRMQAIRLLQQGLSQAEVARRLNVARASVCSWNKKWQQQGVNSLRLKPHRGRPSKLTDTQIAELIPLLQNGARQCGFSTDDWTYVKIQEMVKNRFSVDYHVDHIPRLLSKIGFLRDENGIRRGI